MSAHLDAQITRTLERFTSGGKEIRVETFTTGEENAASIIVLHGATGVEYANRFIATMAQAFAAQGFAVHLVHYFDRTGVQSANDEVIRESSDAWLSAVDDAVHFVRRKRPHAAIGIFGYSLGAYLAAAESVKSDDVAAAVILAGGLDDASIRDMRRTAPTLILHGSADTRVPVTEAGKLEAALKRGGGSPEVHLYSGEAHIMKQETYADVVRRGGKFFRTHLGSPAH